MSNRTRTYLLIEERLGRPLARYVSNARGAEARPKTSWHQIALSIHSATGVAVTSETLRTWFAEAERERISKARAA